MNEFITNIAENVTFVLEFLALVAALVAVAVIAEKQHRQLLPSHVSKRDQLFFGNF